MDPNATLRLIQEHLKDGDLEEAEYLRADLSTWLGLGGFEPDWDAYPRASSYYQTGKD